MDAKQFLKEARRMCKTFVEGDMQCHDCPMEDGVLCNLRTAFRGENTTISDEAIVAAVEQWSKEHPLVTNGQKLREFVTALGGHFPTMGEAHGTITLTISSDWWDAEYKGE
jgi:hypothetical protein